MENQSERIFDTEEPNIFGPPKSPGVYAVCINGYQKGSKERILYIGSAKNINSRILKSKHPYMKCYARFPDRLVYTKSIVTENFIELEKKLIQLYRPLLNKYGKNG